MWKFFWDLLKPLFTFEERLARLEKQSEKQEQRHKEIMAELTTVLIELGRRAERDKWLAEVERAKRETDHWKSEAEHRAQALERSEHERNRLSSELARRQLPPAPSTDDNQA
ncbi:MAG: hypothetical protein HYR56_31830 [Acidobacteria bacterium]|nr:hypothetical protein [Acidobacteriota bacterium]MBI3424284.1 hypothetical protein [Acidobacteriota bacterium]